MEYQVQSVYTKLIVYIILNLVYLKEYIVNMLYVIIILEPFMFFCMICDIMLTPNLKSKIKKINRIIYKSIVYLLQLKSQSV